jgi:hypothetical protein
MGSNQPVTPSELFQLVPDDEVLREPPDRTEEEAALHVIRMRRRVLADPGRCEVDRGYDGETVIRSHFDDEEPDMDELHAWSRPRDETPECGDPLVSQHYAFVDESPDEDTTGDVT